MAADAEALLLALRRSGAGQQFAVRLELVRTLNTPHTRHIKSVRSSVRGAAAGAGAPRAPPRPAGEQRDLHSTVTDDLSRVGNMERNMFHVRGKSKSVTIACRARTVHMFLQENYPEETEPQHCTLQDNYRPLCTCSWRGHLAASPSGQERITLHTVAILRHTVAIHCWSEVRQHVDLQHRPCDLPWLTGGRERGHESEGTHLSAGARRLLPALARRQQRRALHRDVRLHS